MSGFDSHRLVALAEQMQLHVEQDRVGGVTWLLSIGDQVEVGARALHLGPERLASAADPLGQRQRGVVGRQHEHGVEDVGERPHLPHLETQIDRLGALGDRADGDHAVQGQVLNGDDGRQHLADAGRPVSRGKGH